MTINVQNIALKLNILLSCYCCIGSTICLQGIWNFNLLLPNQVSCVQLNVVHIAIACCAKDLEDRVLFDGQLLDIIRVLPHFSIRAPSSCASVKHSYPIIMIICMLGSFCRKGDNYSLVLVKDELVRGHY